LLANGARWLVIAPFASKLAPTEEPARFARSAPSRLRRLPTPLLLLGLVDSVGSRVGWAWPTFSCEPRLKTWAVPTLLLHRLWGFTVRLETVDEPGRVELLVGECPRRKGKGVRSGIVAMLPWEHSRW